MCLPPLEAVHVQSLEGALHFTFGDVARSEVKLSEKTEIGVYADFSWFILFRSMKVMVFFRAGSNGASNLQRELVLSGLLTQCSVCLPACLVFSFLSILCLFVAWGYILLEHSEKK